MASNAVYMLGRAVGIFLQEKQPGQDEVHPGERQDWCLIIVAWHDTCIAYFEIPIRCPVVLKMINPSVMAGVASVISPSGMELISL